MEDLRINVEGPLMGKGFLFGVMKVFKIHCGDSCANLY